MGDISSEPYYRVGGQRVTTSQIRRMSPTQALETRLAGISQRMSEIGFKGVTYAGREGVYYQTESGERIPATEYLRARADIEKLPISSPEYQEAAALVKKVTPGLFKPSPKVTETPTEAPKKEAPTLYAPPTMETWIYSATAAKLEGTREYLTQKWGGRELTPKEYAQAQKEISAYETQRQAFSQRLTTYQTKLEQQQKRAEAVPTRSLEQQAIATGDPSRLEPASRLTYEALKVTEKAYQTGFAGGVRGAALAAEATGIKEFRQLGVPLGYVGGGAASAIPGAFAMGTGVGQFVLTAVRQPKAFSKTVLPTTAVAGTAIAGTILEDPGRFALETAGATIALGAGAKAITGIKTFVTPQQSKVFLGEKYYAGMKRTYTPTKTTVELLAAKKGLQSTKGLSAELRWEKGAYKGLEIHAGYLKETALPAPGPPGQTGHVYSKLVTVEPKKVTILDLDTFTVAKRVPGTIPSPATYAARSIIELPQTIVKGGKDIKMELAGLYGDIRAQTTITETVPREITRLRTVEREVMDTKTRIAPVYLPTLTFKSELDTERETVPVEITIPRQIPSPIQSPLEGRPLLSEISTTQKPAQIITPLPAQALKTTPITLPKPITTTMPKQVSLPREIRLPRQTKTIIPVMPFSMKTTMEEPSKTFYAKAFTVLSKRKGQWIKIGSKLPIGKALKAGKEFTAKTPARSFKLVRTGFTEQLDIPRPSLEKYYAKKGVLIERSKFAIDTTGEYEGITLKARGAKRKKRRKRK